MSLINDALKRASQSDRKRQRPIESRATMQPVAQPRGGFLPLVLGAVVVLALGLAGWIFWQWWNARHAPLPAKVETVITVAPSPVVQNAVPPQAAPPPSVQAAVSAPTPAPVAQPALPPAKPVVAAWPVELKLMGIFFSKTNPRAIINGKTVVVDDQINGIRVTKIEHDKVTVEWNGKVKELVIE